MPPQPTLPDETDVLVVGGGIIGTSTAYFLATETERSVTLVEKDAIASGSTGDSSAILRHHYGDRGIYTRMAWWSHVEYYRQFESRTGASLSYEASPLVRFGRDGTPAGDYARAGYDELSAADIPVSLIEGADLQERFPMLSGLESLDFGVIDEEAAYTDGSDAASGFARAAAEAGARIVTGVAVTSLDTEDGAVVGVETDSGAVACEDIVLAAGPWTTRLAGDVGVDLPIQPTREQVIVLDPPAEFRDEQLPDTPTGGMPGGHWYFRPDFGGGLLVATHRHTEIADPDTYARKPDEETLLELVDHIAETIPGLREAGIRGSFCGIYSVTPDHDFLLDQVGPDGLSVAAGFSGHGFKHGPAVGKIMRDLVVAGESDLVEVDFFSLDRFEDDPDGHGKPDDAI